MKIIVAGDIHGEWGRLNQLISQKQPDLILQCGDFGWWPSFSTKKSVIYHLPSWSHKGIKPQGCEVRFCDGNHEDHWDLAKVMKDHPITKMEGITLYDGVVYQPRGSTFELPDGRIVLFMGGGDSVDKDRRTVGIDWFPEEQISPSEFERAMSHERVDIVISHTCPHEWVPNVLKGEKVRDASRSALSGILEQYKPSLWYHGHWHNGKQGKYGKTQWECLDYPGHGGKWWTELKLLQK